MKKLYSIILILSISTAGIAQSTNTVKAILSYYDDKLEQAKTLIDLAINEPEATKVSKTWKYRGDIYFGLAIKSQQDDTIVTSNLLKVAADSYISAQELDTKGRYKAEILQQLALLNNHALNIGVALFNDKRYGDAIESFKASNNAALAIGRIDTLALYNIGLSYERNEQYDEAISYFEQCYDLSYRGADMCSPIVYLLLQQNKYEAAAEKLKEYRLRYPNDQDLLTSEINLNLSLGEDQKALEGLEHAIFNDPHNPVLYFSLGSVYDGLENYDKAISSYSEALRLDPAYFEPAYNMGALYYNQGTDIYNNTTDGSINEEAKNMFTNAKYYLEIANNIKPGDPSTTTSLEQLKAVLGDE